VRVAHRGALVKERIRLVEEQDRTRARGVVEDSIEVLLSFPDITRDDRGKINPEDGYACGPAERRGREHLTVAGRTNENALQTRPALRSDLLAQRLEAVLQFRGAAEPVHIDVGGEALPDRGIAALQDAGNRSHDELRGEVNGVSVRHAAPPGECMMGAGDQRPPTERLSTMAFTGNPKQTTPAP